MPIPGKGARTQPATPAGAPGWQQGRLMPAAALLLLGQGPAAGRGSGPDRGGAL
jgi:hypothetical protein